MRSNCITGLCHLLPRLPILLFLSISLHAFSRLCPWLISVNCWTVTHVRLDLTAVSEAIRTSAPAASLFECVCTCTSHSFRHTHSCCVCCVCLCMWCSEFPCTILIKWCCSFCSASIFAPFYSSLFIPEFFFLSSLAFHVTMTVSNITCTQYHK